MPRLLRHIVVHEVDNGHSLGRFRCTSRSQSTTWPYQAATVFKAPNLKSPGTGHAANPSPLSVIVASRKMRNQKLLLRIRNLASSEGILASLRATGNRTRQGFGLVRTANILSKAWPPRRSGDTCITRLTRLALWLPLLYDFELYLGRSPCRLSVDRRSTTSRPCYVVSVSPIMQGLN